MLGPKHLALYAVILVILIAIGWFVARGRSGNY